MKIIKPGREQKGWAREEDVATDVKRPPAGLLDRVRARRGS
jgi:hypothetical protein